MSTTAHQIILIKNSKNEYNPLSAIVKKTNYTESELDGYEFQMDGESYVKKYIFNFNPGLAKEELIQNGKSIAKPDIVPNDYNGYHFVEYTLNELNDEVNELYTKFQDKKKHEDIIEYVAEYAHRLNIGNGINTALHDDVLEEIDDIFWRAKGMDWLCNTIKELVKLYSQTYISEYDIKIIMWNS